LLFLFAVVLRFDCSGHCYLWSKVVSYSVCLCPIHMRERERERSILSSQPQK
jgi:hypothetical protein